MDLISIALLMAAGTLLAQPPQVWFGTSPSCEGNFYKCEPFNMDVVKFDSYGDGKMCWTGEKVLCKVRGDPVEKSPVKENRLSVMSYNVFDRPFIATHDGQVERTCRIPQAIAMNNPEVDVIVLEEAWRGGCTDEINFKMLFKYYGWPYHTKILAEDREINGGVLIVSKHKLEDTEYHVYTHKTFGTADYLAAKGFVYTKFSKGSKKYHVVGTHLQAQDGAKEDADRFAQAREINHFLNNKNIPSGEAVIILGDMNIDGANDPAKIEILFDDMGAEHLPNTGALEYSYDPKLNDVVEPGESPAWYDYIGLRNNNLKPIRSTFETIDYKFENKFSYCNTAPMAPYWVFENSGMCRKAKSTKDMSDHFPVVAHLEF